MFARLHSLLACSIILKEMNIVWALVIGLVASIVGGILSGLFVMRKMTHDNKRLYANQAFYHDFTSRYKVTLHHVLQCLDFLGCEINEIKSLANMINMNTKLVQSSLDGLRKWLLANTGQWTSRLDTNSDVVFINRTTKAIYSGFNFDDLSIKYPLQVSQFDKLYHISSSVECLNGSMDLPPSPSNDLINSKVDGVVYMMLLVVEELNRVYSELEYYRKAKPWTWRLFIPTFRN
ncbi:hypothetical protein ES703_75723 [subsurface metagenome]